MQEAKSKKEKTFFHNPFASLEMNALEPPLHIPASAIIM